MQNLADGPERLETKQDFIAEEELCFGDIDFDLYINEDESSSGNDHSPHGLGLSRLLTAEGETLLFRRLNFQRIRKQALDSTLKTGRVTQRKREEIERLARQANDTRNEIAQANLRLVASVARKLSSSQDEFEEMFSEGNTILLYAIDKFDYKRGYRFSTYLTHAVQRHLFRYVKRKMTRQSREKKTDSSVLAEFHAQPEPSAQDLTPEEVLSIAEQVIDSIEQVLDEREQLIVRGRLGLNDSGASLTFLELGEQLGLSKERTRQLFQRAIGKLEQIAQPIREGFG